MANEYYQYQSPVNPGTTIRSNKYNSDQEAIETGFGMVQTKIAQSLKFTAGFAGTQLPQVVTDSMIWVSPSLGASLYPMSTFRADIQSAADNAAAAQLSQNSAAESESNAAASKESAANSANAALSSENTATSKAAIATTKAAEASASASTATAKASTATAKAAEASASASTAAAKADTATTKAAEARASASAALTSEASALASKNSASTSETNALASKNNAAASATSASNSAAAAEQARDEAQQIAGGDAPNALKLGNQPASYYAKASDVQQATTTSRGTVEKATGVEVLAGAVDKYPDAEGVRYGVAQIGKQFFVENDPKPIPDLSTPPNNSSFSFGYGGVHPTSATEGDNPFPLHGGAFSLINTGSAFSNNTYVSQIAIKYVPSKSAQEIKIRGMTINTADDCWVTLQHSHNLATQNDINNSAFEKATSARAVKDFVDNRLSKPAVKHYHSIGNITVDFNQAVKHVVTRYTTANATITLTGTVEPGDELVIINVRDDSGTATITGKTMFTGVGGESAATHTLTGQAKVTMFGFDTSNRLMIAEVV